MTHENLKKQLVALANGYAASDQNEVIHGLTQIGVSIWDGPFTEALSFDCEDLDAAIDMVKKFSDALPGEEFRVSVVFKTALTIEMHKDRKRMGAE